MRCDASVFGIHTTVNGISLLVWNLNAELFLNSHDYLNSVETVQTKIVGEMGSTRDLQDIRTTDSWDILLRQTFDAS